MGTKAKAYGRKGQQWHPDFIAYMQKIHLHPVYKGMPDALTGDGRIQWEAPSNRKSGEFKETHQRRRKWWVTKAKFLGLNTRESEWISKTAKAIHPFGEKPCKRCGTVMSLRYSYPTKTLLKKIHKAGLRLERPMTQLDHIGSIFDGLYRAYGDRWLAQIPAVLNVQEEANALGLRTAKEWSTWLKTSYIPREPALLSPGAMSNAPDRFDGFHSFNLCCRSKADKGRHDSNLRLYTTDRRVFEYWSDGDWIAADRLMGEIRSRFRAEPCANGHGGPCDADHIGPISLGFAHHPLFRLLCPSCNSAKNNRMTHSDVQILLDAESNGIVVASWHTVALWDALKKRVTNDETALRLSKILRDNRHTLMAVLNRLAEKGHFAFLSQFLQLEHAESKVEFVDLRIKDGLTVFAKVPRTPRETKYANEQKARRCRIAFGELTTYFQKENRNAHVVWDGTVEESLRSALHSLKTASTKVSAIDSEIKNALLKAPELQDAAFRAITDELAKFERQAAFVKAKKDLRKAMGRVAELLAAKWNEDRYVRPDWT